MSFTRSQIDRAAQAIKFMVQLDPVLPRWTEKGLREVKWPEGFSPAERKHLRAIAKSVLSTVSKP